MPQRPKPTTAHFVLLLMACGAALTSAGTAQWPQFRGPGGLARPAGESRVPIPFDLERDVRWRIAVPAGHSSPIVSGDRIFLTGYDGDTLHMLAYSRSTGKRLWRNSVKAARKEEMQSATACPAMPTPCTDGKRVYFYFGSYGLVACRLDGRIAWKKPLPVPDHYFGTGNSPILVDGILVLDRDGAKERAVIGFDCADGSERWRIPRLTYLFSYTTPFVWHNTARSELVIAGSGRVTSYDPKNGKELWQVDNMPIFVCPSPTAGDDMLYCAAWSTPQNGGSPVLDSLFGNGFFSATESGDAAEVFRKLDKNADGRIELDELHGCRGKDCFAEADHDRNGTWEIEEIRPLVEASKSPTRNICAAIAAGGDGDITKTHVKWTYARGLPYVASPLLVGGHLYMVRSGGLITCIDARSGEPRYPRKRLDDHSDYYASPVSIGAHVFLCASSGVCYALKAGEEFELTHRVDFGEPIHATPAVLADALIVRGESHLWSIGAK